MLHCSLRLFSKVVKHLLVTMSPCDLMDVKHNSNSIHSDVYILTLRRALNVLSRKGSGKHAFNACLAL